MNDARWLDDLDDAWDDLAAGGRSNQLLDLDTERTISRLHALRTSADAPLAGHERVWSPPTRSRRRAHLGAPRFGAIHAYALIAVLLFASMAGAYSTSRRENDSLNVAAPLPAAGGPPLYLIDGSDETWRRIDPTTLETIPGQSGVAFDPGHSTSGAPNGSLLGISKDGSTIWAFQPTTDLSDPESLTYNFYDTTTKHLRSTIRLESAFLLNSSSLSADGSRFVVFRTEGSPTSEASNSIVTGLDLFDTATGALLKTIDVSSPDADVVGLPVVDANADRAYLVTVNYADQVQNSGMAILLTYDLNSGTLVRKTEINGIIRVNVVVQGTNIKPTYAKISMAPMVLSGDGRSLALMAWDGGKLVILDIPGNHLQIEAIETDQSSRCFPEEGEFYPAGQLAFESNRLVTAIWRVNQEDGTASWLGYCSIDTNTGLAVFLPTQEIAPTGWRLAGMPFLSSDGKRIYLIGAHAQYKNPYVVGTPIIQRAELGIFAFDAATLTSGASRIVQVPLDQNGAYPYSFYVLTESAPR